MKRYLQTRVYVFVMLVKFRVLHWARLAAWAFVLPVLVVCLPFALTVTILRIIAFTPLWFINWLDFRAGRIDRLLIVDDFRAGLAQARGQRATNTGMDADGLTATARAFMSATSHVWN